MKQFKNTERVSFRKKFYGWFLLAAIMLVLIEISGSALLLYRYRSQNTITDGNSLFSTVVLLEKMMKRFGLRDDPRLQFYRESQPANFFKKDDYLGYSANPGVFTHVYKRRQGKGPWESFPLKVTINPDGSRWTGRTPNDSLPNIYILGDSIVFGSGVNDEQTFSYHLQMAKPDVNVRLFALGGYGLPQTYLRFQRLKKVIKNNDIIVIGYADFYDVRSVAAPSRLREMEEWAKTYPMKAFSLPEKNFPSAVSPKLLFPRADLLPNGGIHISYIKQDCSANSDYCNKSDPDKIYMTKVSAALINAIADDTSAKVYVLSLRGSKGNPIYEMLSKKVKVIHARPDNFDYFIHDSVEGFDPHPGPYWHYAISRKLIEALK